MCIRYVIVYYRAVLITEASSAYICVIIAYLFTIYDNDNDNVNISNNNDY